MPAPAVDEALAKLREALRAWKSAMLEVRCDRCGTRVGRTPAEALLAHRFARYEAAIERRLFEAEAPTVPRTPPRKT